MTDNTTLDLVALSIGSALVHSLWQGALIAGITAALLRALRGAMASTRYLVACVGLAATVTSWVATAAHTSRAIGPTLIIHAGRPTDVAPLVALGPAGPDDHRPAIRILPPDALDAAPGETWGQRLEAWSVAAVPVWLAGVLLLSIRLSVGWLIVQRLRRSALAPVSAALAHQAATLARRMRIQRAIRVAQSAAVQVPSVIGWLRPVVLVPMSALTGLTPGQLESILAHELAHIRRHDYVINVLQSAAEVLLFYHPACWWLSRRIRVEREHCCDDAAIEVCGDRLAYAAALADLEALRGESASALARSARQGFALGVTDGPLLQRVRRLIAGGGRGPESSGWAVAAAPLAVVALVLVTVQVASTASMREDLDQTSVPTAARVIPADEGVIQGRVVEASSARPITGASVLVVGSDSQMATTDADGRYEIGGVTPGSYRISVRLTGYVEGHYGTGGGAADYGAMVAVRGGSVTRGIDVSLQRAGSVAGRVNDKEGKGIAGVEVELLSDTSLPGGAKRPVAFAQTDEDGAYRMRDIQPGDYYVRAYSSNEAPADGKGQRVTYASTFYPGVPSLDEAQQLRLYASQELLDVDFVLGTSRRFRVAGTLVDPSGEPLENVRVMLHRMGAGGGPGGEQFGAVGKDGRFEIADVVPDTYMVNVFDRRMTSRWVAATQHIAVDADIVDLELRASLGAQVEGRIVRDVGSTNTLDASRVTVGFEKAIPGPWGTMTMGGNRIVKDGRFSMESPGGPVVFKVMDVPAGWMLKSITLDGTEIEDLPVDFGSGRRQVEIVLTDKVSSVAGMVVDRDGRVLPNYSVVVFPADRSRWQRSSRFILSGRSNSAGQFRLEAVPPGEYLAVAVAALPMNAWQDPDVLGRLERGAERVRVTEGQRLTISIRASPTPEGLGAGVRSQELFLEIGRRAAESEPAGQARVRRTDRKVAPGV